MNQLINTSWRRNYGGLKAAEACVVSWFEPSQNIVSKAINFPQKKKREIFYPIKETETFLIWQGIYWFSSGTRFLLAVIKRHNRINVYYPSDWLSFLYHMESIIKSNVSVLQFRWLIVIGSEKFGGYVWIFLISFEDYSVLHVLQRKHCTFFVMVGLDNERSTKTAHALNRCTNLKFWTWSLGVLAL